MDSALYISAFLLGLAGSLHCIGMCGPLLISLPFQFNADGNKKYVVLLYLVSKAFGYGFLGLLFGSIGKAFTLFNWQQNLSIVAGLTLLAITVFPYVKQSSSKPFIGERLFSKVFTIANSKPSTLKFILLGFLNAALPCGMVYTAIAGATISFSAIGGFLYMFLFGLGTIPILVSIILFKSKFNFTFKKQLKHSTYYFSLAMAVLLILRGMNLGVPFISPLAKAEQKEKVVVKCCSKN